MGFLKGAIEGDFVLFLNLVARMGEGIGHIAIIGDEEEAFAVHIEAADVEDAGPAPREEIEDGGAAFLIAGSGDDAARLEEDGVNEWLGAEQTAADFDGVAGLYIGGEPGDDVPIDSDLARGDELLDGAART